MALRQAGLIRLKDSKVESCDAYVLAQGGMAFVYITHPTRKSELLSAIKPICTGLEGVAEVVDASDAPRLGMPTPEENQAMGDLLLFAKAGFAFKDVFTGEELVTDSRGYLGTHGYLASDPELDGMFVAWGYGIKQGIKLDRIANIDIAPTIADLLGISFPNADGRVLREIFK